MEKLSITCVWEREKVQKEGANGEERERGGSVSVTKHFSTVVENIRMCVKIITKLTNSKF